MEQLPYIDEHSIQIPATPERVWEGLGRCLRAYLGQSLPRPLMRLWGLSPTEVRGDWRGAPSLGDTLVGFAVTEADPPRRLALCGRHRFSRYELVFQLEESPPDGCTLRAQTSAEFPGLAGRAYRALVIGTQGHRFVVGRLLRDVARRA